jgi:hypothetical protein
VTALDERDVERFLGLPRGAFDHIPSYARRPALQAIAKVREMEETNLFRPGLYYIVLADLSGSTESSRVLGKDDNTKRVEWFVTACVEALGQFKVRNYFQFVKEIGDATLFIFSSFEDVLDWSESVELLWESYSDEYEPPSGHQHGQEMIDSFRLTGKRVIHLGEVSYIERANPIALAVTQIFKIEKLFGGGDVGCTEVVQRSAHPVVQSRGLTFEKHVTAQLPGDEGQSQTFRIVRSS